MWIRPRQKTEAIVRVSPKSSTCCVSIWVHHGSKHFNQRGILKPLHLEPSNFWTLQIFLLLGFKAGITMMMMMVMMMMMWWWCWCWCWWWWWWWWWRWWWWWWWWWWGGGWGWWRSRWNTPATATAKKTRDAEWDDGQEIEMRDED